MADKNRTISERERESIIIYKEIQKEYRELKRTYKKNESRIYIQYRDDKQESIYIYYIHNADGHQDRTDRS